MKGMAFKKAFLLGGIFLLATFMLAQSSWGCDDDDKDKRDCDHNDKWDCHKQCQPPKIQRVFLDYQADSIIFEIWGKNFDHGALPVVTLGGIFDLTVDETLTDDNRITATLSSIAEKKFEFGDYRLVVSTCHVSACKEDKYCKDHGPNCKCKYCKEHCSKYKDKYCKENEYKCRCKDKYSLTIAGPPSPPSPIALKIESKTLGLPISESPQKIEGEVICSSGFGVTGGGFSCSNLQACTEGLSIIVSEPLLVGSKGVGWHVLGTYVGPPADLTLYTICAPVQ
jgi:hypothetical protein